MLISLHTCMDIPILNFLLCVYIYLVNFQHLDKCITHRNTFLLNIATAWSTPHFWLWTKTQFKDCSISKHTGKYTTFQTSCYILFNLGKCTAHNHYTKEVKRKRGGGGVSSDSSTPKTYSQMFSCARSSAIYPVRSTCTVICAITWTWIRQHEPAKCRQTLENSGDESVVLHLQPDKNRSPI